MDLYSTTIFPDTTTFVEYDYSFLINTSVSKTVEVVLKESESKVRAQKIQIIIYALVYVIGIIGNAIAIIILRRGERRIRNRRHLLLMTSLAANDLVALMGMLCAMLISVVVPSARGSQLFCAVRVILRVFGIGSVCIAVTMALERYLALTRPFFYQKQVTYYVIRNSIIISWLFAAILTCTPLFGLGLYYDKNTHACLRYRQAVEPRDFGYAIVFVTFGTILCIILVYCNLAVILALCAVTPRSGAVVRRVSKSSCRKRDYSIHVAPSYNSATAEEVSFSKLMAVLSFLFMMCWLPQMATSAYFLAVKKEKWHDLFMLAFFSDLLMLLNYVLDPILYVMLRGNTFWQMYHAIIHCFKRRNLKTSTESMKTSCQQDSLLYSESSGAELKSRRVMLAPLSTTTFLKVED